MKGINYETEVTVDDVKLPLKKACYKRIFVQSGAPTKKLTKSQLTIMCKLGMGPNKEKLDSQFLQTMQVGVGQK